VSTLRSPVRKLCNWLRIAIVCCLLATSQTSPAYSVLTHEQIVDLLWKSTLLPTLQARFPNATEAELRTAHAYAYGGSLIQDIGYYPFGNHFFSDLVHYVRSGDFVANLLLEADKSNDLDQYAFALGALAHYASDLAGHPAVNAAVADTFPKLQAKYGPSVTYYDNPTAHVRTEFGFDVVQVARDRFTSDAYRNFIGFEVSTPVLEAAFLKTYGLPLSEVVPDLDLSIGSFRYSVSRLIPHMTKVAIAMKKDEILKEDPTMTRDRFLFRLKQSEYRREYGKNYQRPNFADRLLGFFLNLLPKIGPLKTLDFKMPTLETENLYMESVLASTDNYHRDLNDLTAHTLVLDNRDFDTGGETLAGEYPLTDQTYSELLDKLAGDHFAQVTPELQANLINFYRDPKPPAFAAKSPARWARTLANLKSLQAIAPQPVAAR